MGLVECKRMCLALILYTLYLILDSLRAESSWSRASWSTAFMTTVPFLFFHFSSVFRSTAQRYPRQFIQAILENIFKCCSVCFKIILTCRSVHLIQKVIQQGLDFSCLLVCSGMLCSNKSSRWTSLPSFFPFSVSLPLIFTTVYTSVAIGTLVAPVDTSGSFSTIPRSTLLSSCMRSFLSSLSSFFLLFRLHILYLFRRAVQQPGESEAVQKPKVAWKGRRTKI